MSKNKIKNEKAITLIALIVTIIVLLILAGVSIAVLTGDNSILRRSSEAKVTTKIAEIEEQANLIYTSELITKLKAPTGSRNVELATVCEKLQEEYGEDKIKQRTEGTPEIDTVAVVPTAITIREGDSGEVTAIVTTTTDSWYAEVSGKYYRIYIPEGKKQIKVERTATNVIEGTFTPNITFTSNVEKVTVTPGTGDNSNKGTVEVEEGVATTSAQITVSVEGTAQTAVCAVTIVKPVTITLDANGGTIESNATKTYSKFPGETISSLPEPNPEDANHTFGGWYDNSQFTGSAVTTITATTIDKTYYAKWTQTGYGSIGTQVYLNNNNDITITFGTNDTATIPDDWRVFYEDQNNVYLIYGHYYPVTAQRNTDQTTIKFGGNRTYAVSDSTNRTNLLRYLRNNSAYNWNSTSPYGDDNGTNGTEYTSWSKLKTALSGLSSLSGKTINVQGSPDIDLWDKSWVASGNTAILNRTSDSTLKNSNGYLIRGSTSSSNVSGEPGYSNTLYFPYTSDQTTGYGYWLASPGALDGSSMCLVACDSGVGCGDYYGGTIGCARPVVSIAK